MSLFSPFFRSLDQEIAVLEKRIELRRSLTRAREEELRRRLTEGFTSPAALAGVAVLGLLLARGPRRKKAGAVPRKGLWATVGGVGLALLQMRFGSPYQWIARALMGAGGDSRHRSRNGGGRPRQPDAS